MSGQATPCPKSGSPSTTKATANSAVPACRAAGRVTCARSRTVAATSRPRPGFLLRSPRPHNRHRPPYPQRPVPDHVSTTRAAYDATAEDYARLVGTEIRAEIEGAVDRALLAAFAEHVAGEAGPVLDVGCGPGRVAALLQRTGTRVIGFDLSTGMLAQAARAHPGIPLGAAQLAALPVPGRSVVGVVAWYSVIHTPPEALADAAAELARVLRPGGHLLVAFQAGGGERVHRAQVSGTPVDLVSHHHDPDHVADCLSAAGLRMEVHCVRAAQLEHESTPQAFLLARAPDPA